MAELNSCLSLPHQVPSKRATGSEVPRRLLDPSCGTAQVLAALQVHFNRLDMPARRTFVGDTTEDIQQFDSFIRLLEPHPSIHWKLLRAETQDGDRHPASRDDIRSLAACRLLANGRGDTSDKCPLSGDERTQRGHRRSEVIAPERGMSRFLSLSAPFQHILLAGQEHGRTSPLGACCGGRSLAA